MKPLFRPALTASAALVFAACLGGLGGDKDTEIVTSYEDQVLEIDRTEQTITVRRAYWYCDDGTPVADSADWEENYRIQGGKLYLWGEYDCRASVSRGSSSDIVGTWTADPPDLANVPGADPECDADQIAIEELFNSFNRNLTITSVITEARFKTTFTGEYCWAEQYARILSQDREEEVEVSAENCSSINLARSSDGRTARIESDETSAAYTVRFITGETRCSATFSQGDSGEPDCGTEDPWYDFTACVDESGYFGEQTDAFDKRAVPARVRRAALRASR